MKQYNGKQGCAYCEDEGTPRPSSHLQRNWLHSGDHIQRTHEKMRGDAKKAAEEGNAVCDDFTSVCYVTGLIVCHVLFNFFVGQWY